MPVSVKSQSKNFLVYVDKFDIWAKHELYVKQKKKIYASFAHNNCGDDDAVLRFMNWMTRLILRFVAA